MIYWGYDFYKVGVFANCFEYKFNVSIHLFRTNSTSAVISSMVGADFAFDRNFFSALANPPPGASSIVIRLSSAKFFRSLTALGFNILIRIVFMLFFD